MSHLSAETIARLVDDAPDSSAGAHLAVCDTCARELDAMRSQTLALKSLGEIRPRRASWLALERRLQRERLVTPVGVARTPRRWRDTAVLQMAAGIFIFVLGTGVGSLLASRGLADRPRYMRDGSEATLVAAGQPGRVLERPAGSTLEPVNTVAAESARLGVRPSAAVMAADPVRDVHVAEAAYLRALARYTEAAPAAASDPVARLAALEGILMTTSAALQQAPADPVIDGYYLTALAQRDAALRQMVVQTDDTRNWF